MGWGGRESIKEGRLSVLVTLTIIIIKSQSHHHCRVQTVLGSKVPGLRRKEFRVWVHEDPCYSWVKSPSPITDQSRRLPYQQYVRSCRCKVEKHGDSLLTKLSHLIDLKCHKRIQLIPNVLSYRKKNR